MGKTEQPGSAETPVKSRARRAAVPPCPHTLRGCPGGAAAPRGSSAGWESGRSRDLCIYLFVALKTERWKERGGGGGGITGFLNAFAVHA